MVLQAKTVRVDLTNVDILMNNVLYVCYIWWFSSYKQNNRQVIGNVNKVLCVCVLVIDLQNI